VVGLLELLKRTGERRLRSGGRLEHVRDSQRDGSGECLDAAALLTRQPIQAAPPAQLRVRDLERMPPQRAHRAAARTAAVPGTAGLVRAGSVKPANISAIPTSCPT
jgi:hypothetical protein